MKMTLMEAVMAHVAAAEMGRQTLPYSLALALVKIKQATQAEMETFAAEERKLVEQYAARDEDGNIRVSGARFTFRDPRDRADYEEDRRRLGETQTEVQQEKLTAPAPDSISPEALEALSKFIDFQEGAKAT